MILISFVDGMRVRSNPKFLFIIVPQRRKGMTQLIQIMVYMGFSNNLKLSNLSPLWRTLLEAYPFIRKAMWREGQEMRTVWGCATHARRGEVRLMAASLHGRLGFPAFSRVSLQVSVLLFPSLQKWGRLNIWGLKGELAGPRAGGRLASGGRRGPHGRTALQAGPGPQRGHLLLTHFNMCFQILPNVEMTYVDKTSVFHNLILMWFPLREC